MNMHWKGVHNSERDFTFKKRGSPEREPCFVLDILKHVDPGGRAV